MVTHWIRRRRWDFAAMLLAAAGLSAVVGCANTGGTIPGALAPSIVTTQIPEAQRSILAANETEGRLPNNSAGDEILMQAIRNRTQTMDESDGGGNRVKLTETIDGIAYDYLPARNRFLIAIAGRIVRAPDDGGTPNCTWYCFRGVYDTDGALVRDKSQYVENARLFLSAMRNTANNVPWNCEAWAITEINRQAVKQTGSAQAEAMVQGFIDQAMATGQARVLQQKTPREMAFGGKGGGTPPPAPN
jgi:hypothetical protein